MKVEKDFEELFRLFNKHKVHYCIVGSYAVAFYSKPRYTKDIDILIEPSLENSVRVARALDVFGFGGLGLSERDFRARKKIIQLGFEPLRIDLLTSVQGATFGRIWKNKVGGPYGREKVYFIGLNDLMSLKKRSRRLQDKMDLETIREFQKSGKPKKKI